jgi:glycosyltransferase involved in cell wall biosynthesis
MIVPVDVSKSFGSKIQFINLAVSFEKLGLVTKNILYNPEKTTKDKQDHNINIRFVPNPLSGNVFFRVLKYLLVTPFIIWDVFIFKPQLVYMRFSTPVLFYQLVLKCLKISRINFKVTLEFHDWVAEQRKLEGHNRFKVFFVEKLQLYSAHLADSMRVVAEGIKEKFLSLGVYGKKISVIENGTDLNLFKPIDRKKAKKLIGVDSEHLDIGFIGMFAVWQGLDNLLDVIPKIIKKHKNVRFLIVGDGPLMRTIKKAVSRFPEGKVILTGRVPYSKANLYINSFDIGIAPFIKKRNDGMVSPMKIRDYAACGVPIITTNIRGLEMIAEENIGILVPPDNTAALSEAIIKLIGNPTLRRKMGKQGRRVAEEKFSWQDVAERILETANK